MIVLTVLKAIGGGIASAANWFWFKATLKLKLAIVAGVIILATVLYIAYLKRTVSSLETEAQQQELNRDLESVQETVDEADKSAANFNAASSEANRIRNANFSNTSLSEAEKARCRAYPESRGCQK